jgi:demethylmenaquinone methyltransferase/2-methoxy-6-polyprenyl-1,4-benzoquinol methylase
MKRKSEQCMEKEKRVSMDTTHFGFDVVPKNEKAEKVAAVFHSVAKKYDVMNDIMSGGLHRLWKKFTITQSGVRAGQRVLDIAGGTGDLARAFAKRVGAQGEVWLTDINHAMLMQGRDRLVNQGIILPILQCDAEKLPFPSHYFDCVCVAFGLRNMTNKEQALTEMYRVLKPGGRLLILEFSQIWSPLKPMYDIYSLKILPLLGKWFANDADSYRYLAESIRMHPNQTTLQAMMQEAGFTQVDYFNLAAGIVALHKGYRTT